MNGETLLYRQVNPAWIQSGRVTSQVFKPTLKDDRRLSVYDGDLISATDAWSHYTDQLGFASDGVLAISFVECESLDLPAESAPEPFPEHAVIRFDACTASQIEKKAKRLKAYALARNWLYRVVPES